MRDENRELTWLQRAGPTWAVAFVIYLGWGLLTWHYAELPWWLVLPAGGYLLAWHGSLQHEAVHGQLAPWRWPNDAIAHPPLGLWLPFPIYRATHRAHHDFEILTEPWRDPESFYVDQSSWRQLGRPVRIVLWAYFVASLSVSDYLPKYKIEVYPFAYLAAAGWLGLMAYAVFKHRLMDIQLVIRKTLVYSLITAVLTIIYVYFVTLFAERQDEHTFARRIEPLTLIFIECRLGNHRRFECFVEWLMLCPVAGPFPQMSHFAAIRRQR